FADDGAGVPQDRVDERRFSGVRFPNDREREWVIFDFRFSIFDWGLRKKAIDRFKEFRYPAAVGGADGDGIVETELCEIRLEVFVVVVIDVIYDKHAYAPRFSQT